MSLSAHPASWPALLSSLHFHIQAGEPPQMLFPLHSLYPNTAPHIETLRYLKKVLIRGEQHTKYYFLKTNKQKTPSIEKQEH